MERKGTKSLRRFCQVVLACSVVAATVVFTKSHAADLSEPPIIAEQEFKYACVYVNLMYYRIECAGLSPPVVVTSRIVGDDYHGLHYVGESFVFVNRKHWLHNKPMWHTAVLHETVHYIIDHVSEDVDRCQSEEIARRATHLWENSRYDDEWRQGYNCT